MYLTLQLIEMGKPVVLALNMMDEAERKHIKIDVDQLSEQLGIPVIPISALKQKGIKDLLSAVVEMHHHKRDYQAKVLTYSEAIEAHVAILEKKVETDCGATKRWTALKIIEQDEDIAELSGVSLSEAPANGEMLLSEDRYKCIAAIVAKAVDMSGMKQDKLTQVLDQWLLNKWIGLPLFGFVMWLMFYMTFNVGGYFADWIDKFFTEWFSPNLSALLTQLEVASWMQSLIVDGIVGGVGGILTFVPNIAILFIIISILEDSGYMARVAYLMDFWMSKVGLNGKSFIPMILGFGCNVPAIMSTRTVGKRERPAYNHFGQSVYELWCEIPGVCAVCWRVFPRSGDVGNLFPIPAWGCYGTRLRLYFQKNPVQRGRYLIYYGVPALPNSEFKIPWHPRLGTGSRLLDEGGDGYSRGFNYSVARIKLQFLRHGAYYRKLWRSIW